MVFELLVGFSEAFSASSNRELVLVVVLRVIHGNHFISYESSGQEVRKLICIPG